MADNVKVIYTPSDLIRRMEQYPKELDEQMKAAHADALKALHQSVPPYPPKPAESKYIRTGDLGAGLGSGMGGGQIGQPTIYETNPIGQSGMYVSAFGSDSPDYNQHVIGETTQVSNMSHWWRITAVLRKAAVKIDMAFNKAAERMTQFLGG